MVLEILDTGNGSCDGNIGLEAVVEVLWPSGTVRALWQW